MRGDDVSEALEQEFTTKVDKVTVREGISLRDTARIYRELASAFRDRANGLESEADANEEESR